jgi:hypothetical protein
MTIKDLRENGTLSIIDKRAVRDVKTGRDLEFDFNDTSHPFNEYEIDHIGMSGYPHDATVGIYIDAQVSHIITNVMHFIAPIVDVIESIKQYITNIPPMTTILMMVIISGCRNRLLRIDTSTIPAHIDVLFATSCGFTIDVSDDGMLYYWGVDDITRKRVPHWSAMDAAQILAELDRYVAKDIETVQSVEDLLQILFLDRKCAPKLIPGTVDTIQGYLLTIYSSSDTDISGKSVITEN